MNEDTPGCRIDIAHAKLVEGLVCAHKPARVLEFGFGGGRSAEAILRGLEFNQEAFDYTLVDSWADWQGSQPMEAAEFLYAHPEVKLVEMAEREFVHETVEQFDFIMSDADHWHTHEWFERVYADLLAPGGVLIYHDVTQFPGLIEIAEKCRERNLRHVVFEKNTRVGECCQRGLLCIFKESP